MRLLFQCASDVVIFAPAPMIQTDINSLSHSQMTKIKLSLAIIIISMKCLNLVMSNTFGVAIVYLANAVDPAIELVT